MLAYFLMVKIFFGHNGGVLEPLKPPPLATPLPVAVRFLALPSVIYSLAATSLKVWTAEVTYKSL
jgi:hypothetical protein